MACKAVALLAGVDTLIVNIRQADEGGKSLLVQEISDDLVSALSLWQEQAKQLDESYDTSWIHEQRPLQMQPHGISAWRWLLKNGYIDLLIGARLHMKMVARVRFSSEYLWRLGVEQAVQNTHDLLKTIFGERLYLQVAEIHLCADLVGLDMPKEYAQVFVSHAAVKRPIKQAALDQPVYRYQRLETLQFSGHGNAVSAVIYDKPAEIKRKSPNKKWFHDLWREQGWDEVATVWRVECRLERKGLHEMDIESVSEAIDRIPALWAYCVGHAELKDGWLRMVQPNTKDSNRWRWETTEAWKVVQQAFTERWRAREDIESVQRLRKRQVNLERAEAAIAGYATTYGAWLEDAIQPDDDVSVVFHRLYERICERWEQRGIDFHTERLKKQQVYHLPRERND